ncbi:DUF2752 domain-containing protein [Nocardioides ferulae]|uniref:DUF2752 domain-containing protein n=1 Tax=Nocardioides ferulae TaxID=2340821 RepID=UPI000EAC5395|nr:DUF2752 domain-containing protein [Nocardioides ferulae]
MTSPPITTANSQGARSPAGWRTPVGGAALALAGVGLVLLRDPHREGALGICPSLLLTGGYCPGCGSLRGVHDLATGQLGEAVGHNLLLVPALVWLVWWWVVQVGATTGRRLAGPPSSARFCWLLVAGLAVFTIARNLPGSPLAP